MMKERDVNKKEWVVVTGASSGIGEETTNTLLTAGYAVVVVARREAVLLEKFGGRSDVEILPWDLSDSNGVGDFAKAVKGRVGAVRGLVHCAGMERTLPIHMTKTAKIEDVFALNTYAAMNLVGAFAGKGMTTERASFVLISSLSAHEGAAGKSIYAASKAALEGFTRAGAPELAERGIRINCIAPGVVETPMVLKFSEQLTDEQRAAFHAGYPLGVGQPTDVAAFIEYLLSDKARWITGQTFILDGGRLARR
jgi:NAD(P)-dependent dehydrogenase (short-subunit alcohol dehydrogenase family)